MTQAQQIKAESPTAERMRHARGMVEAPEVTQKSTRRAYRVVPAAEWLHKLGKLSDACLSAYERIEEDYLTSTQAPSGVWSYGLAAHGSSSEGSQDPMIRKEAARRRYVAAMLAMTDEDSRHAIHLAVAGRSCDEIGRQIAGHTNRPQASAVGAWILRTALYKLHLHYERG